MPALEREPSADSGTRAGPYHPSGRAVDPHACVGNIGPRRPAGRAPALEAGVAGPGDRNEEGRSGPAEGRARAAVTSDADDHVQSGGLELPLPGGWASGPRLRVDLSARASPGAPGAGLERGKG